jgi:hypothetical protein
LKIFHGGLEKIVVENGVETLKKKLDEFFEKYLKFVNPKQTDIFDLMNGFHFLPVDCKVFLKIQSTMNQVENLYDGVRGSIFFYENFLLFSRITHSEAQAISQYISAILEGRASKNGFLMGPEDITNQQTKFYTPRVYLGKKQEPFHIVMYQYQKIRLLLFIEEKLMSDFKFYNTLHSYLSHELNTLMVLIGNHINQMHRYLHSNWMIMS